MLAVLLNCTELLKSWITKGKSVIFAVKSVMVQLMEEVILEERQKLRTGVFFGGH
jgi:hypothetical protein